MISVTFIRGLLLAASLSPVPVAIWIYSAQSTTQTSWTLMIALATSLSFLLSSIGLNRYRAIARWVVFAGCVGLGHIVWPILGSSPAVFLLGFLCMCLVLASLWFPQPSFAFTTSKIAKEQASMIRGACFFVMVYGSSILSARWTDTFYTAIVASFYLLGFVSILLLVWLLNHWKTYSGRSLVVLIAFIIFVLALIVFWKEWKQCFFFGLIVPMTGLLILPSLSFSSEDIKKQDFFFHHPERLFVGTFFVLCTIGSLLLLLPISIAQGQSIQWINAAFTSVSAVCVTGLVVVDISNVYSGFGQAVIMGLIQLGGLGVMTFSVIGLRIFGTKLSLRYEGIVARIVSPKNRGRFLQTAGLILKVTLISEGVGACILFFCFIMLGDNAGMALWRAVFTSVSAFCNAGFALQSENMVLYQQNPLILQTVSSLIILGGLSPLVVISLPSLLRKTPEPILAQTKIALVATCLLLVLGFVGILSLEWSNTLSHMSFWDRVHNAWFQSVTLRTAGFNTIDISSIRSATFILMIVWMFIGGNPGGTAGGVKTTTVAILGLAAFAAFQGRGNIDVFSRHITSRTVYRAVAIFLAAISVVIGGFLTLLLTQPLLTHQALFEVVSALGTVGLSQGATNQLDAIGKGLIMTCMFVGRVGPLTFLMFLRKRNIEALWKYPQEDIDVG